MTNGCTYVNVLNIGKNPIQIQTLRLQYPFDTSTREAVSNSNEIFERMSVKLDFQTDNTSRDPCVIHPRDSISTPNLTRPKVKSNYPAKFIFADKMQQNNSDKDTGKIVRGKTFNNNIVSRDRTSGGPDSAQVQVINPLHESHESRSGQNMEANSQVLNNEALHKRDSHVPNKRGNENIVKSNRLEGVDIKMGDQLTVEQKIELKNMLYEYHNVFFCR